MAFYGTLYATGSLVLFHVLEYCLDAIGGTVSYELGSGNSGYLSSGSKIHIVDVTPEGLSTGLTICIMGVVGYLLDAWKKGGPILPMRTFRTFTRVDYRLPNE